MASKQDVRVTESHYPDNEQCHGENRPIVCTPSITADVQPAEQLLLQHRRNCLDAADEESCPVYIATSEQPSYLTIRSREEVQLLTKRREQKLQHQICEESLKHLVNVKELEKKLQVPPCETAPKPPLFVNGPGIYKSMVQPLDHAAAVSATATSGDVTMNENSRGSSSSLTHDHELIELNKKLRSQRIRYQIEIEEAVHKIKMKGLAI